MAGFVDRQGKPHWFSAIEGLRPDIPRLTGRSIPPGALLQADQRELLRLAVSQMKQHGAGG